MRQVYRMEFMDSFSGVMSSIREHIFFFGQGVNSWDDQTFGGVADLSSLPGRGDAVAVGEG